MSELSSRQMDPRPPSSTQVVIDDERCPIRVLRISPRDPERARDHQIAVGQQRERQLVLFFELHMRDATVRTDPQQRHPSGRELRVSVTKRARLRSASRTIVGRIEKHDHRLAAQIR